MTAPQRPPIPRHPEGARYYGGPADGQTVDRARGHAWPRFRDDKGEPVHGDRGESLLRAPRDRGDVYVHHLLPAASSAPILHGYVWSAAGHTDLGLDWQLIATTLAGSHIGRILTGGSNDPDAILAALAARCDNLIRIRDGRRTIGRANSG